MELWQGFGGLSEAGVYNPFRPFRSPNSKWPLMLITKFVVLLFLSELIKALNRRPSQRVPCWVSIPASVTWRDGLSNTKRLQISSFWLSLPKVVFFCMLPAVPPTWFQSLNVAHIYRAELEIVGAVSGIPLKLAFSLHVT